MPMTRDCSWKRMVVPWWWAVRTFPCCCYCRPGDSYYDCWYYSITSIRTRHHPSADDNAPIPVEHAISSPAAGSAWCSESSVASRRLAPCRCYGRRSEPRSHRANRTIAIVDGRRGMIRSYCYYSGERRMAVQRRWVDGRFQ